MAFNQYANALNPEGLKGLGLVVHERLLSMKKITEQQRAFKLANRIFRKSVEISKKDHEAWWAWGCLISDYTTRTYFDLELYKRAGTAYRTAIELNPDHYELESWITDLPSEELAGTIQIFRKSRDLHTIDRMWTRYLNDSILISIAKQHKVSRTTEGVSLLNVFVLEH